VRGRVIEIQ